MIQSDSFVCHSANFDPRIKILLFFDFTEAGLLKKTICQGVMEAEKMEKPKGESNWMKPPYSPF